MEIVKIKKTYKEIISFVNLAHKYIDENKEAEKQTKLLFILQRLVKECGKVIDQYNDEIADIRIDFYTTDKDKNLIKDDKGNFCITAENQKKFNKAVRDKMDSITEAPSCIDKEMETIVKKLPFYYSEAFYGFVIPEEAI